MKKPTFSKIVHWILFLFENLFQKNSFLYKSTIKGFDNSRQSSYLGINCFKRQFSFSLFLLMAFLLTSGLSFSQLGKAFVPRLPGGNMRIKGDVIFVGNSMMSRTTTQPVFSAADPNGTPTNLATLTAEANQNYNTASNNNGLNQEYTDIDTDATTFASSSAELNINNSCKRVVYAGLYWSAIYPYERSTDSNSDTKGTARKTDWNQIMFKVPGAANYTTLVADNAVDPVGDEDDIIFDGYKAPPATSFTNSPYVCYKNVTAMVQALADPNGNYFAANIRAAKGKKSSGSMAGWTLVVVYESPTLPSRYISTFDGFAGITSALKNLDFSVNGFKTLPSPLPVRATIGVAAQEGESKLYGDDLLIKANTVASFTYVNNTLNPLNNVFNSSITVPSATSPFSVNVSTRVPNSLNTLGFDMDLLNVDNPNNKVIPNGETGATYRLTSTSDTYGVYVTTFAVDIIEPKIVLTKIVKNKAGTNIGNSNVTLGDYLNYEIGFKNIGNDDAENFTIKDVLPVNILFDPNTIVVPSGSNITYTYTPATRTLIFTIPKDLVKINGNQWIIKFGVQVVPNCNDLSDACSDQIKNQAYATYNGLTNPAVITDDPSISVFGSCNLATPSATNFLVGVDGCKYTKKYQLCGANVTISAANGYDKYSWSTSPTGSPVIGTTQSITVTNTGTYYVHNTAIAPCVSIDETVTVEPFGTTSVNPVIAFADEVVTCPNNGKVLSNIYLCGDNAKRYIRSGVTDANSIIWEKSSCALISGTVCADETNACIWTQVANGPDFNVSGQGQYRVTLNYVNGCFSRYFFNVYENKLNPTATSRDIICNTNGEIVVGTPAAGSGYEYSLDGVTYQASNILPINTPDVYTVYIRSIVNVPNRCVFTIPGIQIRKRDFTVSTTVNDPLCNGGKGSIKLAANDVRAQYYFSISKGGVPVNSVGPIMPNDYTFSNLYPGTYDYRVKTEDGCDISGTVTLVEPAVLTATANITKPLTCESGEITVTPIGGTGPYTYFINSTTDFQGSPIVPVTAAGTYNIRVVDFNNCEYTIAPITINDNPKPIYTVPQTNVKCYGSSTGEIKFNVTNANGYTLSYSFDNGVTYSSNDTFSNLVAGTYKVILKYSLGGVDCFDLPQTITITEPSETLTASAGVSELAGCGDGVTVPKNNGKIRITNPQGGVAPYQYSFDNQVTWSLINDAYKAPGTYTVYIKDAVGCIYSMPGVIIDPEPVAPIINVNTPVDFNCDGTATSKVIINNPGSSSYSYDYFLDNVKNTNVPSNEFINVPVGSHAVRVEYKLTSVPTYSNLLFENFGYGDDTTSPGMNAVYYCFERQVVATQCKGSTAINDGDYSVTAKIVNPFGPWLQPGDHTTPTVPVTPKGRCLVVNIGDKIPVTEILYEKVINNIIPNQPINVEFFAMNLLNKSNGQFDPDLRVALVDATGTEISWYNTGNIPKSEKWENYPKTPITLNPGTNTTLKFIVRSNVQQTSGNDVAIDDIKVYQLPKSCITTKDFTIVVPTGKAFTGSITGYKDAKCNGGNDGEITIAAQNFGASFQYSIDNGLNWTTSTTSPVTIPNLAANTYNIKIRPDATSAVGCTKPFTQIIAAPVAIGATTTITTLATCSTGATITTTATGGTPAYEYELRNAAGVTVITSYQASNKFTNVPAGSYTIFVRDANLCSNPVGVPVTVIAPTAVTAVLAATSDLCYDTVDRAKLVVTATGTGTLTYQLDSNAAQGSNVFTNVGPGTHTILVTDSNNCTATISNIIIAPQLQLTATLAQDLTCLVNASITSAVTNGYGVPYTYTVSYNGGTPTTVASFPYTALAAGTYEFTVNDSKGCPATSNTITVSAKTTPTHTTAKTDITCNNANDGTITVTPANGFTTTYTYAIKLSASATYTTQTSNQFTALPAGIYNIKVIDSKGCESVVSNVTIVNPGVVAASINATEMGCSPTGTVPAVVTVTASGGTGSLQYSFNGASNFTTSNTYSTATAGTVTAYVKDANNCQIGPLSIVIVAPEQFTSITITDSGWDCATTPAGGHVNIAGIGVSAPKRYSIISGPAGFDSTENSDGEFKGLAPGAYIFQARDTKTNCTITKSYTVSGTPDVVAGGSVISSIKCFGGNGNIQFTVSGLQPDPMKPAHKYDYIVTNTSGTTIDSKNNQSAATISLNSLPASNYTIVVTDRTTKCTVTYAIPLTQPTAALAITSATPTNVNCNNDNSQITVVAANGTPNYMYAVLPAGSLASPTYVANNVLAVDTNSGTVLSWDIYVKDANDCTTKTTVTVISDAMPAITAVVVNNQCTASGSTFTITATPSVASLTPLTYGIAGPTGAFQTSPTFTVGAGTYTVYIKDKNGCIVAAPASTTVYPQLTVLAQVTKTLDCNTAGPNATITATITGGKANYSYVITNSGGSTVTSATGVTGPTITYTGAAADTYTVTVTDANTPGCTATSTTKVDPITNPTVSPTPTNVTCNTGTDGQVKLAGSLGTPSYTYSFNGSLFTNTTTYTGLSAGISYPYLVKDSKGCVSAPAAITLTEPGVITATVTLTKNYTCLQLGEITVSATAGGTSPYTYSIGGAFQSSPVFTGLTNGTYTITVKDNKGCTQVLPTTITIAPLAPPTDLTFVATTLSCDIIAPNTLANTSSVQLTTVGGVAALSYQIIAPVLGASQGFNTFNDLAPNTYTFKVTDANSCSYQESYTIDPLPVLTVVGTVVNNAQCDGSATGAVNFTVGGFGAGYTYTINGGAVTAGPTGPAVVSLTGLTSGVYTIIVTNTATNCTATTNATVLDPPTPLTAVITTTPITCLANGSVTYTAGGGWGGYAYTLTQPDLTTVGPQAGKTFANLTQVGAYTVSVKDANGCIVTDPFNLSTPVLPVASIAGSDLCYDTADQATITVTSATGVAPFTYSINGGVTYQNSGTFANLTPGNYSIIVKDFYGCTSVALAQTIAPQLKVATVLTKDLDCTGSPDAVITGTITPGYPGFNYAVSINGGGYSGSTAAVGNAFTYGITSASVLANTTYQFQVTDANSCSATSGIIIVKPKVYPTGSTSVIDLTCNGSANGSVTITPSLGVAPYRFSFNGSAFTNNATYGGLTAGTYNYSIMDSKDCVFSSTVSVTEPALIDFTPAIINMSCPPASVLGSIEVTARTNGVAPFTYVLKNTVTNVTFTHIEPAGANYIFSGLSFGDYTLTVTDSKGCSVTKTNLDVLAPPAALTIDLSTPVVSCASGATIVVSVNPFPVPPGFPYSYGIYDLATAPFSSALLPSDPLLPLQHTFNGLTPGVVYTFVIFDSNTGCYYFQKAAGPIPPLTPLTSTIDVVNPVTCKGTATGSVSFTVSNYSGTDIDYEVFYDQTNISTGITGNISTAAPTSVTPLIEPALGTFTPGTYYIKFTEQDGLNVGCESASATFVITESAVAFTASANADKKDNCNHTGQISAIGQGGTLPYQYELVGPVNIPYSNFSTFPNPSSPAILTTGNYTVNVRDANGCIVPIPVFLDIDPTPVVAAVLNTQCGITEGNFTIDVTLPTAGIAPYSYSIDGGAYQNLVAPFSITGLSSGSHTVQVKDFNGCGNGVVTVPILAPLGLTPTVSTIVTCPTNVGAIKATATGGSGTYSYTLLDNAMAVLVGPQALDTFSGLAAGDYNVRVTDGISTCDVTKPIQLIATTPVTFDPAAITDVNCNGDSTGSIIVNIAAANDNPVYQYELIAPSPALFGLQQSNIFTGLPAGNYKIRVTSGKGCIATQDVVISEPTIALSVSAAVTTQYACASNNTVNKATITVTAVNGTPGSGYTYSIDGINYFTTNTFDIIDTGSPQPFTVYTIDANGCLATNSVTVNPLPKLLTAVASQLTAIDCTNGTETIKVDVTGGSPLLNFTYEVSIDGAAYTAPIAFSGLTFNYPAVSAGSSYVFRITDVATGCTINTAAYDVPLFNTIDVIASASASVQCNGQSNGAISINVTGYTGAYTYIVYDGTATNVASGAGNTTTNPFVIPTGLLAGTYTVEVTGGTLCIKTSNVVTITQPAIALGINVLSNVPQNCGTAGAQVTVTGVDGTPGYMYAFLPSPSVTPNLLTGYSGPNTATLDPLVSGSWDIYVKDANDCTQVTTVAISADLPPTIVLPTPQCFVGTPITLDLSLPAITTVPVGPVKYYTINGSNQTSSTYTITAPGTYKLSVVDANGCSSTIVDYVVQPRLTLMADMTQDLTCALNASVTLTAAGGETPYVTYEVNDGTGYVASANPFTTATAGTYKFRVTDTQGCQAESLDVIVTPTTTPTALAVPKDVSCIGSFDGTITLTPSNGIIPYQYSIDGGTTYQDSNVFAGLGVGSYTILVRDAKMCSSAAIPVIIGQPSPVTVIAEVVTPFGCDTANAPQNAIVTITAGGGTLSYTYSFDNGANWQPSSSFSVNSAQTINYVVRDANGCSVSGSAVVDPYSPPTDMDITVSPIYCSNAVKEATVTVNSVTGGVSPYTYEIIAPATAVTAPSAPATSFSFANLAPDTYTIKVTDANGCSTTKAILVEEADKIAVTAQLINDVYCNGGNTGVIEFTVANYIAAGNYTYGLVPVPAVLPTINGDVIRYTDLPAGSYTFSVTDGISGCIATVVNFAVDEPALALSSSSVATNINCTTDNATVTISAAGGTGPYKYAIARATDPVPAGTSFIGINQLTVDTNNGVDTDWVVYVLDANGCSTANTQKIIVDASPTINTALETTACPNLTGNYNITVNAFGFNTALQYSIDGVSYQTGNIITVNAPGTYNVTVKDANGCTSAATAVTILEPLILTPTVTTSPSCADFDGVISVATTGGSTNYSYNIDGGGFGATTPFTNVGVGAHIIGVRDTTNSTVCDVFVRVVLEAATPITGFAVAMTPVSCNGGNDGTITATMNTPSLGVNDNPVYMYSLNGGTPQASNLFSGLAAGVYTVDVLSGRGCPATANITVTQPGLIVVPVPTVTQYSCTTGNASNYATISIDPLAITGGTTPYLNYEFIRNGISVYLGSNNSYTEADLLGGNYSVKVYDSNGCSGSTVLNIPIAKYIALDKVNVVVNNGITCANLEDITVNVATVGGTPNNLSIKVQDVIYDAATGSVPTYGFIYDKVQTVVAPTASFTGLPVGNYLITVKNLDTNCEIQDVHYVNEPNTFDLTLDNIVNVTCLNATNGSAKVTFIDRAASATYPSKAGAFSYTIVDALGNTYPGGSSTTAGPITLTGLGAGTYTVTAQLTNPPKCPVSRSFTITGPTAALTVSETHTEITCVAPNSGSISATATGGWPGGYEYQLSGPINVTYSPNSVFTNLTAGDYTLNVRDTMGCIDTKLVTLSNPTLIAFTATPSTLLLTCNGDTSASITVGAPTGGQGSNYLYTLNRTSVTPVISSGPQISNVFTDLGAGTYTITVTDGWGCGTTSSTITIGEPIVIVASLVKASTQTCNTQATLTLSVSGGTAPYSYSSSSNFAGSIAMLGSTVTFPVNVGTYHYYVRDVKGCASIVSNDITIDPLPVLKVDVNIVNSKVNCKGDATGVIIATATGGLGNYTYTLLNGAGLPLAFTAAQVTPGNFTQLPAGSYIVHVDSGVDCQTNSILVDIKEPPTSLNFTYSKTDVKCSGNGDGTITVNGFDGTGIIKYAITPRSDKFLDSGVFTNLKPGPYTVIIQDENGCYLTQDVTIIEPNPIDVKVDPLKTKQELCAGEKTGEFVIDIKGGTAPYSTVLDDANGTYVLGSNQVTFSGLSGGDHTVYIKDANLCTFELIVALDKAVTLNPFAEPVEICENNAPAIKVVVTIDDSNNPADVKYSLDNTGVEQDSNEFRNVTPGQHFIMVTHKNTCAEASNIFTVRDIQPLSLSIDLGELNQIVATASGGSGEYQFTLNGEHVSSATKWVYFRSGNYLVTMTDSKGCTVSATKYFEFIDIKIPPIFTPTGDGTNDTWKPTNTENYPDIKFVVYDRYGREVGVFGAGQSWDGKYNGTELPMGDYWYVLKLRHSQDDREFIGHFTLYR